MGRTIVKLKNALIILVAIIIYTVPITCILFLSEKEIKKYELDVDFDTEESAYGKIYQVERRDVAEYYGCDVRVTCIVEKEILVPNSYKLKVKEEDEIFEESILATDGTNNILAGFEGVICGINYDEDNILISYKDFDDTVFECHVPEDIKDIFEEKKLYNEENEEIKIISKSNINDEGNYLVYLSIPKREKYDYGTCVTGYKLYTGKVYKKTLVINKNCIYKGEDGYYVRQVDENGIYIADVPVEIGYQSDGYTCISGVEEGDFCDGGYETEQEVITSDKDSIE